MEKLVVFYHTKIPSGTGKSINRTLNFFNASQASLAVTVCDPKQGVFNPILDHYKVKEEDKEYIFTFFTQGIISVVFRWIKNDCKEEIDTMINLIQHCVRRVD